MRKTTDPKERKHLTDREFNTFGRGAIEDAPAELLYGKGALAEAFNINCYPQYFEGRSGSRLLGWVRAPAMTDVFYGRIVADDTGNMLEVRDFQINDPWFARRDEWRYVDMATPYGASLDNERAVIVDRPYISVDKIPRAMQNSDDYTTLVMRGKAQLMTWHTIIGTWVRVEGGRVCFAPRSFLWQNSSADSVWRLALSCDVYIASNGAQISFIATRNGGIIYALSGIYKWVIEADGDVKLIYSAAGAQSVPDGVVFRINLDAPARMKSRVQWNPNEIGSPFYPESVWVGHVYRYVITGARIRGTSRLEGGVVDFETPASDHNFRQYPDGYGLVVKAPEGSTSISAAPFPADENPGPVGSGSPNRLSVSAADWADDIGAITHLSVYRTGDLEKLDVGDPARTLMNSPNAFALVADIPLLLATYGTITANGGAYMLELTDDPQYRVERLRPHDQYRTIKIRPNNYLALTDTQRADYDVTFRITKIIDLPYYGYGKIAILTAGVATTWQSATGAVASAAAGIVCEMSNHGLNNELQTNNVNLTDDEKAELSQMVGKPLFLSDGEAYTISNVSTGGGTTFIYTSRPINEEHNGKTYAIAGMFQKGAADFDFADAVDDTALNARKETFYPRTLYRASLPNCNIAASVPGWVLCAVEGESKLYYTNDDEMGGYTHGSHNGDQLNEQVKDQIKHIELFPDVVAIFGVRSTWNFPAGIEGVPISVDGFYVGSAIPTITIADAMIGCTNPRSIQHISGGEIVLLTHEAETPAVRIFNGRRYGDSLIVDTALGLSRNKNKLRAINNAVAVYGEEIGYIVWAAVDREPPYPYYDKELMTISDYCFRVAIKPEQGGGITEYGGEHWLWPDAQAAAVSYGVGQSGKGIILVEDARTGFFYVIGNAEQKTDRAIPDELYPPPFEGYEIPTRAALPIIADGYKWQKHLETHIAMRCWKSEYRGAEGFTKDGFKPEHKVSLKIYEDGEVIDEASALQDLNRNGDYAYLKKVEARRIQEVIETTTSAFKVSQVVVKVQTSDREALPADNEPLEVKHQREWRTAIIHLSRNLPCPTYNRVDGTEIDVLPAYGYDEPVPGEIGRVKAPTGKPCEAFWVSTGYRKVADEDIIDFTASLWIRPSGAGDIIAFRDITGAEYYAVTELILSLMEDEHYAGNIIIRCTFTGTEILRHTLITGVWQHVALRRQVRGQAELLTLYVNGETAAEAEFMRAEQMQSVAGNFDEHVDMATFDVEPSYQNTTNNIGGSIYAGREITIGQGRNTEYFDIWLMLSAVSPESIKTYYDAVVRGGEGWLP